MQGQRPGARERLLASYRNTSAYYFHRLREIIAYHLEQEADLVVAGEIEDRVFTGLKDILVGNQHLIDAFVIEFKAQVARLRKNRGARERQSQKAINKVNTDIKRCLTYVMEGDGDPMN